MPTRNKERMNTMSLNNTPRAVRTHIAFFGKSNAGKSSIINAITGQALAIVSPVRGTTTDPVYKSMEILPLGPCELIDTAGLDDVTELGQLRIAKTLEVLGKTDAAVYVADAQAGVDDTDTLIIDKIKAKHIPLIIAVNKSDAASIDAAAVAKAYGLPAIAVSAVTNDGVNALKELIAATVPQEENAFRIVGDIISPGDLVVLVTPIDSAAPKGRLILPQQQVVRDVLDSGAIAVVTREHELRQTLGSLGVKPRLVITDSQAFAEVSADTPGDIPLTSFSILFARYKGDLPELVRGAAKIKDLKDGDTVLVAEGCTHHKQSDDIGTVKIPRWLRGLTGKALRFEHSSGCSFGEDLKKYALIVHCGACMIGGREMKERIDKALEYGVPIVNYGVLIAYVQGILGRVLEPFHSASTVWEEESR